MNYTENYHLPQWEETDRIMRVDFNEAMSNLDSGLTACRDTAAQGSTQANAALLQGLFRLAYNHYFHLLDAEKDLWQTGVFTQSFARGAGGKVTGMLQQENMVWTGQYQDDPGTDAVSTARKVQTMAETGDTYSFSFSARRGVHVTGIKLTGDVNWPSSTANNYTIRLVNKSKNTVDAEIHSTLELISSARFVMPVDFVLHTNQAYQIDIIREDQGFPQLWLYSFTDYLELENAPNTVGTATLTLKNNEPNLGGAVFVHYTSFGTGGTLSLNWDNEIITPHVVRSITGRDGRNLQIAEFRRTSEIPVSSTIKLTLTCSEGGDMELYRMGGMLV